jgi:dethiobiotin synthetase
MSLEVSPQTGAIGPAFFVTGTDTAVGKTFVSVRLLHALRRAGKTVLAMKPVAAGCEETAEGWRNEDVEALRDAASFPVDRDAMNPYLFLPPISPHLAAAEAGVAIEMAVLRRHLEALKARADWVLVEGAGGWLSPVSNTATMADLAFALKLPVLLVVGLRLGCLNHALLTFEAIRRSGLPWLGWVANGVDPSMSRAEDNLAYLVEKLGPPLARVAHGSTEVDFDLQSIESLK